MLEITCPLCQSSEYKHRFVLNGWQLVQCVSCDFVYVNPRPAQEELDQGYSLPTSSSCPTQEAQFNISTTYQAYYTHGHQEEIKKIDKTLQQLLRLTKRTPTHCRLLDFGCGGGTFLQQAILAGIEAYGCDLGDWSVPLLQQKHLMSRVFIGHFDDAPYPDSSFDVIHASAVMGHLYAPCEMIEQLRSKLKPGGILALKSTPNIDSLFIRLGLDSFDGNVPLTHVSYFSKKTLLWLLQQHGFHPVFTNTFGVPLKFKTPSWLAQLAKPFRKERHEAPLSYYQSRQELCVDNWQDVVIQSPMAVFLRKLHLYDGIKAVNNALLNLIDGGQVIDVIAIKR